MHEPWNSPPVVSLANSEIQRSYSGDNGAMTPPLIELQMKALDESDEKDFKDFFKHDLGYETNENQT